MLSGLHSLPKNSSFDGTTHSRLRKNSKTSSEEESSQKLTKMLNGKLNKQERFVSEYDNILKRRSQLESAHDIFIQRLLREATSTRRQQRQQRQQQQQQQQQRLPTTSSNNSYDADRVFRDENNDWLFEKILQKFEDIRSKRPHEPIRSQSHDVVYGVERIVERRYYVKKPKPVSKRNQITSTDDFKEYERKIRQLSGESSVTEATTVTTATSYSQCSSSTPTYVESLRNQSVLLRDEISELKDEIQQLQTSQKEFFEQLKLQSQSSINSTTASQNLVRQNVVPSKPSSEKKPLFVNVPLPSTNGQRSRSVSTESIMTSSRETTPNSELTLESTSKPILSSLNATVTPALTISEFIATKNSSIPPIPPVNARVNSKTSLAKSASSISEFIVTKNPSIVSPVPVNVYIGSKPPSVPSSMTTYTGSKLPSIASTPPVNTRISSKSSSIASTPRISEFIEPRNAAFASTSTMNEYVSSKPPSVPSTTPVNTRVSSRPSSTASTPRISEFIETKNPAFASTSIANEYVSSKSPSVPSTTPINTRVSSRPSSTASTPRISEFIETKNSAFASTSTVDEYISSKFSSIAPTPPPTSTYADLTLTSIAPISPVNSYVDTKSSSMVSIGKGYVSSKSPSIPPTPSPPTSSYVDLRLTPIAPIAPIALVNSYVDTKSPSFVSTGKGYVSSKSSLVPPRSPLNTYVDSKPPSELPTSRLNTYVDSKTSSAPPAIEDITRDSPLMESMSSVFVPIESTELQTSSLILASPVSYTSISLDQTPVYENELAHRRTLSPRSQIVASSAQINDTPNSSVGWSSPELNHSDQENLSEVPMTTLQHNDLNALVQYSSQLESSGFPPLITHVIANPNTSSTFWEAVDEFIENYKSTTTDRESPPIRRAIDGSHRYILNDSTTKQLDKYNLEIKPQEDFESSAPLLMPPLDNS
ncbi:unnamed protein product [Rotaria sordida]|uniref:Uncharacterized protein n=1 Tax=Rotaria sordida TaxID=392033 RepID=A0A814LL41_9BILA|nr:unnamed protein product [Rotaria sordida]